MLKFYRKKHCPNCHSIENLLEELNQDYQIVLMEEDDNHPNEFPEDTILPALVDGDKILQGSNAIIKRIEELETFKFTQKLQGDGGHSDK